MINRNFITSAFLFLIFLQTSFAADDKIQIQPEEDYKFKLAVIRVLDKVSAKSLITNVELEKETKINNNISVKVYQCWKSPSYKTPETKILLRVLDNENKQIFFGWLFASAPSVSSIEHPIYDIVAIDCK